MKLNLGKEVDFAYHNRITKINLIYLLTEELTQEDLTIYLHILHIARFVQK